MIALLQKAIIYTSILFLLFGCATATGKAPLLNHIDELEQELDNPKWGIITAQTNELKHLYNDNKWKLQLLGDESEYEGLNESINKIIAATKEKDTTNVRIEIATARSLIIDIYSL